MDKFTASRTALATSLMRAVHTRIDPNPLIDDAWGDRLVPEAVRQQFAESALGRLDGAAPRSAAAGSILDGVLQRSPAFANVITRTRYSEDALQSAISRGVRQYVLVGAGFDSFILRRPASAASLEIFEIDHPATQGLKLKRIGELGISLPNSVHFIAADLSQESVATALSRSSFRADRLSFFSWLGVSMYLEREANLATLRSFAHCALANSELVFTYMDARVMDSQSAGFRALQARVTAAGEPFVSGFDPAQMAATLKDCGLELCEDLGGEAITAKYGQMESSAAGHSSFSHMALARVLGGIHAD